MSKDFKMNDMVSHPPHYQSETGLEVIDVIEAFTFDLKGIEATDTGNIIKYICRWNQKNGVEDLKKAKWYLEHLIAHVEKLEEENKCHIDNPFFETKEKAEEALNAMKQLIDEYGLITAADMYYILHEPNVSHLASKIGWISLQSATIEEAFPGYIIVLPAAIAI